MYRLSWAFSHGTAHMTSRNLNIIVFTLNIQTTPYGICTKTLKKSILTVVLLSPDMPCPHKQCRSWSVGEANWSGSALFLYPPTPANFVCICVCVCGGGGAYCFHVSSVFLSVRVSACDAGFFLISWKCSDGYSSLSADTLISITCTYIRESKG